MVNLAYIRPELQKQIDGMIIKMLKRSPYRGFRKDVHGYIANLQRGEAHYQYNAFFVPYWAFNPNHPKNIGSKGGYFIYYVAHELSHMIAFKKHGVRCYHDARFYEIFETICPKEYQHFELQYKSSANYINYK
jgi:predicted SprT family Zn-dependent metalloprotease